MRPLTFVAVAAYAFAGCTVTHHTYDPAGTTAQGPAPAPAPVPPPPPAGQCAPEACGPRPTQSRLCPDGVTSVGATGRCLARPGGACSWEVAECPAALPGPTPTAPPGPPPRPTAGAGERCGTLGALLCGEGLYCRFAESAQCGIADRPGVCEVKPTRCPREDSAVCGCDGKTYANACTAHARGVSVKERRACGSAAEPPATTVGQRCGTRGAAPCGEGTFCGWPESAHCGATDRPGVCMTRPTMCTREFKPVCGCDGKTYPNACSALAATVSVDRSGACPAGGSR